MPADYAWPLAYDTAGNLTTRTYPDGTATSYVYDPDSRMTSATQGPRTTAYAYDAAGNLTTRTCPDATTTSYAYDADSRRWLLGARGF